MTIEGTSRRAEDGEFIVVHGLEMTAERMVHLEVLVRAIPIPELTLPFVEMLNQAAEKQKGSLFFVSQPILRVALDVLLDTMKSLAWHLDDFMWHSGIRDARNLLRRRMLAHIIDYYPELAEVAKERVTEEDGSSERW